LRFPLACRYQIKRDIDDHVFLASDELASPDLDEDFPGVDLVDV
jgi:hypothetical protein